MYTRREFHIPGVLNNMKFQKIPTSAEKNESKAFEQTERIKQRCGWNLKKKMGHKDSF